jgi:hypothetical protein
LVVTYTRSVLSVAHTEVDANSLLVKAHMDAHATAGWRLHTVNQRVSATHVEYHFFWQFDDGKA